MNDLWREFRLVLKNYNFCPYIKDFGSNEELVHLLPVIVELNKMNVRLDVTIDNSLSLVFSAMLRYIGMPLSLSEYFIEHSFEESMAKLKNEYKVSDKQIQNYSCVFEKFLNANDYSSVLKWESFDISYRELLNCFFGQVFGAGRSTYSTDKISMENLLKMYNGRRNVSDTAEYYCDNIIEIIKENKVIGYVVYNGKSNGVVTLYSLQTNGYTVCGCRNTVNLKSESLGRLILDNNSSVAPIDFRTLPKETNVSDCARIIKIK